MLSTPLFIHWISVICWALWVITKKKKKERPRTYNHHLLWKQSCLWCIYSLLPDGHTKDACMCCLGLVSNTLSVTLHFQGSVPIFMIHPAWLFLLRGSFWYFKNLLTISPISKEIYFVVLPRLQPFLTHSPLQRGGRKEDSLINCWTCLHLTTVSSY